MIAAARAGVASVEHELLGRKTRHPRLGVKRLRRADQLAPRRRRMHVHLDDAGIRCHEQRSDAWIARRRITFDEQGLANVRAVVLDGADQRRVGLDRAHGRHEHAQMTVAHFDDERRLDHFARLVAPRAAPVRLQRRRDRGAPRAPHTDPARNRTRHRREARPAAMRAATGNPAANRHRRRTAARGAAATGSSPTRCPRNPVRRRL